MLVLSRKIGQKITIGDNIIITVVGIGRDYTQLGIDAPREIPILRDDAVVERQKEGGR
jgi:carbon storage regulator